MDSNKQQRSYENLKYYNGLGNHFESEALPGALPKGQNNPQKCPFDLFCEGINGTSFTAPRAQNQMVFTYRIKPSSVHTPFEDAPSNYGRFVKNDFDNNQNAHITPNQLRWKDLAVPKEPTNFIEGIVTFGGAGDPTTRNGMAIHLYSANNSMKDTTFFNSDGDFLIVPFEGVLYITTELGKLTVKPREIAVIPRGVKFEVECTGPIRGYIAEVYKRHFQLPELGPIGANGLANPRDFEIPVAYQENHDKKYTLINKFMGKFFQAEKQGSPYDVVAWHGRYYPFKYNLELFNAISSVTYDHPDPSIYTVLTSPTDEPGIAACDFVVFIPRWSVSEHTFRPPWFHKNVMTEFVGNITGVGVPSFQPGYSQIHSSMQGHGINPNSFQNAVKEELKPVRFSQEDYSFMLETTYMIKLTTFLKEKQIPLEEGFASSWLKYNDIPKDKQL